MEKKTARRSVFLEYLTRHNAPLVIFCDADIVMETDALEILIQGSRFFKESIYKISHFCGFRYNRTIWDSPPEARKYQAPFSYILLGPHTSMAFSLIPLDIARKIDKEGIPWHPGKWSLNEYASRAWKTGQFHSCYITNVPCQHIGVGNIGHSFTDEKHLDTAAYNEDGSLLEITGFDVLRYFDIAYHGTFTAFERFCHFDKQEIYPSRPVHPEFIRLRELIREKEV